MVGVRGDAVDEVLSLHRGDKAELIPLLQQVQGALGYLSEDALSRIAAFARVPESTSRYHWHSNAATCYQGCQTQANLVAHATR